MSEQSAVRALRIMMWVVIVVAVPVYLVWLVEASYQAGQLHLAEGDFTQWAGPVLLPATAVVFCSMTGAAWWLHVTHGLGSRSPLRERWTLILLGFVAVMSVGYGLLAAEEPSLSVGLLYTVITGLGMIGLFFIPAARSRQLPDVIRRRSSGSSSDAADEVPGR